MYKLLNIKNELRLLCLLSPFISFQSGAMEGSLRFSTAESTTKQNLNVNKLELSYLFSEGSIDDNFDLNWYPVFNLSALLVGDESTIALGSALGLSYSITKNFTVFSEGGVLWLGQYEFGKRGVAFKDYGGSWQFQAKLAVDYQITKKWNLGYAYFHMSNGEMYDINPSLDAHSLHITYQF